MKETGSGSGGRTGDSRVGLGPAEKYSVVARDGRKEDERGDGESKVAKWNRRRTSANSNWHHDTVQD